MLALIGLAFGVPSGSSYKGFLIFASIALALTAARRLNNAITAWTDLMDLATYAWLASVMWVPVVAAWTLAWNRWCLRPWRSIDVAAVVLAVAGIIGAVIHSASVTSGSRLGSIALFFVIGARIVRSGPMRILLVTLTSIMAGLLAASCSIRLACRVSGFRSVSACRGRNVYAIAIPSWPLVVRTLVSEENARSRGEIVIAGRHVGLDRRRDRQHDARSAHDLPRDPRSARANHHALAVCERLKDAGVWRHVVGDHPQDALPAIL
jgi:hypothetical protein